MFDTAEQFLKYAEAHHPNYREVCNRTPLLTKYKMQQMSKREISMSLLDYQDRVRLQEADADDEGE